MNVKLIAYATWKGEDAESAPTIVATIARYLLELQRIAAILASGCLTDLWTTIASHPRLTNLCRLRMLLPLHAPLRQP